MPVLSLVSRTLAPGTIAPVASRTVPVISVVDVCANKLSEAIRMTNRARVCRIRIFLEAGTCLDSLII